MALIEPIKIEGLAAFSRNLRKLDSDLPKGLRLASNEAGQIVVNWAQPKVPVLTGTAAGTMKTKSTRTSARVSAGSKKAPYYAWLDFGGRVGRQDSVERPFIKGGRYMYPGYAVNKDKVQRTLLEALVKVAEQAGVAVDS